MAKIKDLPKIINFIFEVGTARNVLRTHHQVLRNSDDNVASHSFRVAIIGLILADLEEVDKDKVVMMCLLHDLAELRTGDANFIHKFYRKENEEKAIKEQWADIPVGEEIIELLSEYNERKTKEAIIAKDADILEQIFLQKEYMLDKSDDLKRWHNHMARGLKTGSAREIADSALETSPLKWVYDFSDSKKINENK